MRRLLRKVLLPVVAVLASTSSPASAEPAVAADVTFVSTVTNQVAWAHQCAAFHCGYHAIPASTIVRVACYVLRQDENENREYDLVVAPFSFGGSTTTIIAGYVDRIALRDSTSQRCADVGPTGTVNTETWAHSCPSLDCGYGQMYPNENIGPVCRTTGTYEGRYWDLLIDHSPTNANLELAGFVPIADWPHADPTTLC